MSVIVGIDVGGTFTDLIRFDSSSRTFTTAKVPSRRGDEAQGFLNGLRAIGGAAQGSIVHGTTVGTNTLLERRGPKIGVITTRGFRDVLEMRRRDRPRTWGLWGDFTPIADRDMRLEVSERTLADGTIRSPVDAQQVRAAAKQLIAQGAQAIAIIFINAYANALNERTALTAVREVWPNDYVTASHEVLSEIREFERSSTAAINAYLQPVVASYVAKLEGALAGESRLHIVQSNGGIMSTATARKLPVRTALSGPAAGVVAGAALAKAAGFDNLITCDLGGTSFDVSLIANGKASVAAQTTIEFGLVIRTPMVEITTIGAGGGSIAWVDRGGVLQVGPGSAGSGAGPACYGQGNTRPAVTHAPGLLGPTKAQRGLGAWSRLLRTRQHAADVDRRSSFARPHQCAASARRRVEVARRRGSEARDRGACRHAAWACDRRCRRRDRACRRRPHGRRHSPRVDRARARSAEIRRDAVRRRWRAACRRADPRGWPQIRACAAFSRDHVRARLRSGGSAPRHGADRQHDARRLAGGRAGNPHGYSGQGGERRDRGGRHSGRTHRCHL